MRRHLPHPRAKEKPQQDGRRGEIILESNSIPARMLRGLKQTLCTPEPGDPTETETELCLSVSCGGMGQQWTAARAGALGAVDLDMT